MITGVASFEQTDHYRGAQIGVQHDDPSVPDVVIDAGVRADECVHGGVLLAERLQEATDALDGAGYRQVTMWALADGRVTAVVQRVEVGHRPIVAPFRGPGGGMECECSCGGWATWIAQTGRGGQTEVLRLHAAHEQQERISA